MFCSVEQQNYCLGKEVEVKPKISLKLGKVQVFSTGPEVESNDPHVSLGQIIHHGCSCPRQLKLYKKSVLGIWEVMTELFSLLFHLPSKSTHTCSNTTSKVQKLYFQSVCQTKVCHLSACFYYEQNNQTDESELYNCESNILTSRNKQMCISWIHLFYGKKSHLCINLICIMLCLKFNKQDK